MSSKGHAQVEHGHFRAIWPPRMIWLYDGGRWRKAQLEGYRQTDAGGFALVRPNPGIHRMPGECRWVPAHLIRAREGPQPPPSAPPAEPDD